MQSLFIKEVRGNKRGIRLFCKNGVIIFFPSARAGFLFSLVFPLFPIRPTDDGFFARSSARALFIISLSKTI